jgi:hypothetical protein
MRHRASRQLGQRSRFLDAHSNLGFGTRAWKFKGLSEIRILFLDKRNQMIADEVQQKGTVDHTPVYVREVVKRALELSATAVVLVHNHPSGDPTPSRADIEMTKQIVASAKNLGIELDLPELVTIGARSHHSVPHQIEGHPPHPEAAGQTLSVGQRLGHADVPAVALQPLGIEPQAVGDPHRCVLGGAARRGEQRGIELEIFALRLRGERHGRHGLRIGSQDGQLLQHEAHLRIRGDELCQRRGVGAAVRAIVIEEGDDAHIAVRVAGDKAGG